MSEIRPKFTLPNTSGENSPNAKLTEAQVREIRKRYLSGERPCDLGRAFGISGSQGKRTISPYLPTSCIQRRSRPIV